MDFIPAGLNQARIKIFAPVNRGERDRPRCGAPGFIGVDQVHGTVCVFEADLGDGLLRAERAFEFGEASAAEDVEHAVAEFDTHRVITALQGSRDVVRVVEACLVIFRPAGRKKIGANALAVQYQFVMAEAADIHQCPFERGLHGEFAPE